MDTKTSCNVTPHVLQREEAAGGDREDEGRAEREPRAGAVLLGCGIEDGFGLHLALEYACSLERPFWACKLHIDFTEAFAVDCHVRFLPRDLRGQNVDIFDIIHLK